MGHLRIFLRGPLPLNAKPTILFLWWSALIRFLVHPPKLATPCVLWSDLSPLTLSCPAIQREQSILKRNTFLIITFLLSTLKISEGKINLPINGKDNQPCTFTLREILSKIIDKRTSKRVFHSVTPHGLESNITILASLKSFSSTIRRCRNNLTAVVRETFPWIRDEDIFKFPRVDGQVILGMDKLNTPSDCESHLTSLFGSFREEFPPLDYSNTTPNDHSNYDSNNQNAWSMGVPRLFNAKEEINVTSQMGFRVRSKIQRSNKFKKAKVTHPYQEQIKTVDNSVTVITAMAPAEADSGKTNAQDPTSNHQL